MYALFRQRRRFVISRRDAMIFITYAVFAFSIHERCYASRNTAFTPPQIIRLLRLIRFIRQPDYFTPRDIDFRLAARRQRFSGAPRWLPID